LVKRGKKNDGDYDRAEPKKGGMLSGHCSGKKKKGEKSGQKNGKGGREPLSDWAAEGKRTKTTQFHYDRGKKGKGKKGLTLKGL